MVIVAAKKEVQGIPSCWQEMKCEDACCGCCGHSLQRSSNYASDQSAASAGTNNDRVDALNTVAELPYTICPGAISFSLEKK
jgi:hypothetical protein